MSDVWPIVHAERAALIADLETLTEAQWDQPSLCDGWSVHDVVAHIIDTAMTTRLGFVYGLARAGFDFDRQNAEGVERERGPDPAATLLTLREVADRTWTPPAPMDSRIVEMVVHGEDIRRPLGITRSYPQRALQLQARTKVGFGGAKEHLDAVRVTATDSDVSVGDGPEVRGPSLSLLLALSGRRVALAELDGPGVALLANQL
ncbi:MAG TPA: maleylpyruvate isomerase family mycothiol-dependent enzyme [Arachnia sp.]|nr:maleylpyruvate isomerase family mycothiol-dependent enzyme [Arachnia sp.]